MEDNFAIEVVQRLTRIETKLDTYNDMKTQVDDNAAAIEVAKKDLHDHERRIGNIEDWGKWLVMAVGVLIIGGVWQVIAK